MRILACTLALALIGPAVGAEQHWAFQPVRKPAVPAVRDPAWVTSPVDAFILAKLEQNRLKPAPAADRRVLLRRVYLDLVGLPPTPDEQRAFLDDKSPDAFRRLVDDLLSRPQYGERWGRHWLDVARYAETNGYERDGPKPSAWRYRDYVIKSFNDDKPFDRFLTEQIAGDELADASAETLIATTFLRLGTWDDEPAEPMMDRYDQLDDVLGTTTAAILGITLRCARCHDHKFEPFTQADYYRVLAAFEPLRRPQKDRADLDREVGTQQELAAVRTANARADTEVAELKREIDALNASAHDRLPESIRPQRNALEKRIAEINATRPKALPRAYIWFEDGKAPVTHVLYRGDPMRPRKEVTFGVPAVLTARQPEAPKPTATSSGRRLALARWMANADNPLVSRVIVNRVWQWHFGRGLVATANDFGTVSEGPSHAELLDWLASEFMANGWSLKKLHRTLVLSSTYQMATVANPEAARIDPKNALLWRWRQRRLEAEAVRDSVLSVSGQLHLERGGPSVYPTLPRAVLEGQSRPGEGWGKSEEQQASRRSVYIYAKRNLAVPELEVLDVPDNTTSCEARTVSTIAPQALTFLNGEFINRQARHFAARLEREGGTGAKVDRAFVLALCRPPRAEELKASLEFLAAQEKQITRDGGKDAARRALESLCLVLLNTNEFVYLD